MQKVFNVAVDIGRKLPAPAFEVNTNDLKSVKLIITITNGQTLLNLTDTTVRIAIRKPDNHIIFQDCTVKDATNGQVEIILENQAYIYPGTHTAEIMCYKDSEVVAVSGTFSYKSTKGIMNDEAVESKSEFTVINQKIEEAKKLLEDAAESGVGVDEQARQDIEEVAAQLSEKAKQTDLNTTNQQVQNALQIVANTVKKNDAGILNLNIFDEATRAALQGLAPGQINAVLGYKNVKPENTDFFNFSTNLFDKDTVTRDKTLDPGNGAIIDNAGGNSVSVYIKIKPNTPYNDYRINRRAFYSANKTFISHSLGDYQGGASSYTTPANAEWLVLVVPTVYLNTAQLNEGSTKLPYEPFYTSLPAKMIPLNGTTNDKLTNINKNRILQGNINFDFANNLIKFLDVGILYGKSMVSTGTQNLDITSLASSSRYILYFDVSTSQLGTTDISALSIPENSVMVGMFRKSDQFVWGIDSYQINGKSKIVYDLDSATKNTPNLSEVNRVYPVKSQNMSPLSQRGIVSGTPVNFDFLNNKISIKSARIVFGNRAITASNLELNISNLDKQLTYILYYNLADNRLGAVNQSYSNEYGSLPETAIILATFNGAGQYVEGLTNYTMNDKPYKLISTSDVGKDDYPMLDADLFKVFTKNKTIPSQATEISASKASDIYAKYDALMAQHPKYITRTLLGNEPTGLPIYLYEFKPKRPLSVLGSEKNTEIILLAGTHPEKTAVWTQYNALNAIYNDWKDDKLLEALRYNIDFTVVPIVNPWSYNNGPRTNSNGVDLNRNYPSEWEWASATPGTNVYRGPSPLSEIETQLINRLFNERKNKAIGVIDFHNFDVPYDNYLFFSGYGGNKFSSNIMRSFIQRIDRKWKEEYSFMNQSDEVFIGDCQTIISGGTATQASALGYKGAISFEVDWKLYADPTSQINDSITMTLAYEGFINFLGMFITETVKRA